MVLEVHPGPFNANDGDRIKPNDILPAFVSGTDVQNLGFDELGYALGIPISSTEPPPLASRTRGTLWFQRGDGRLYKWDVTPTGTTDGRWVSVSDRKEALVHYTGAISANEILWRDTSISLPAFQYGRFTRQILNVAGGATGFEFDTTPRESFFPPHFVAQTDGATGDFQVVVDRGFCRVQVSGATGPGHGVLVRGTLPTFLQSFADPLPTGDGTMTYMGYIVESTASVTRTTLLTFFTGLGSNLTK